MLALRFLAGLSLWRASRPSDTACASSDVWAAWSKESCPLRPSLELQQCQQHPGGNTQDKDGHRNDQCTRPGKILPVLVRTQGKLKNDHRQIGHRSIQVGAPKLIVERGEQQRRGFTAD